MKKSNSQGFAATLIIVVVVVLGLIGGIGFYVYKQHANQTHKHCCAINEDIPTTLSPAGPLSSLELADMGLKINPGTLTGLTVFRSAYILHDISYYYSYSKTYKDTRLLFSTKSLEEAADCAAKGGPIGYIYLTTLASGITSDQVKVIKGTEWYIHKTAADSYIKNTPEWSTYGNCKAHTAVLDQLDTAIKDFKDQVTIEKL